MIDGDETYASIFDGISRAKDCVLVQVYIIQNDSVGLELRDKLVERAKARIRCHLLYDEIGSRLPKSLSPPCGMPASRSSPSIPPGVMRTVSS